MAAPFVTSVTFDKAAYAVGETVVMTAIYGDADHKSATIEFKTTDAAGNATSGFGSFVIDPPSNKVIDPDGRVWTLKSDTGTIAVYTSKA